MSEVVARVAELRQGAADAIAAAPDAAVLEELRVRHLGRKAALTGILRGIGTLPAGERGPAGSAANAARAAIEELIAQRRSELEAAELEAGLGGDALDVTLPGVAPVAVGTLHPITTLQREIEDIFVGLGYRVAEGPEIEHDYYNFTALNHPPGHPARMVQDTFYVDPRTLPEGAVNHEGLPPGPKDVLLRTHTSPMQVRSMEASEPPLFVIVPGRVYRRDSDATHTPMFSQIEGLAVAEDISLADLAGTLQHVAREIFGPERETRLKPDYFPFTEPSVQVDVSCFACDGSGSLADGSRDPLCKGSGWIEILGAGMVDPNVFAFVADNGYDPGRVQGFAFGLGIERIAMLRHGIGDLRIFFENDLRFLGQFR